MVSLLLLALSAVLLTIITLQGPVDFPHGIPSFISPLRSPQQSQTSVSSMTAIVHHIEKPINGRLVVIGDLHGCLEPLVRLLSSLQFENAATRANPSLLGTQHTSAAASGSGNSASHGNKDDVCVSVGDLVNKGPASFEVVRFLRELGAHAVLGNHDIKMIRLKEKLARGAALSPKEQESTLLPLARDLPEDLFAFLQPLPHIITVKQFNVIVSHAGLDPSMPLEHQDIEAVTRMRNLVGAKKFKKLEKADASVAEDALSRSERYVSIERAKLGGKPWAEVWSRQVQRITGGAAPDTDDDEDDDDKDNNSNKKKGPKCLPQYANMTCVFGHDAKRRLQQYPYAIGLDSGCVYAGQLSALVMPQREVISVPGWMDSPIAKEKDAKM